jgi:hypothetical protein
MERIPKISKYYKNYLVFFCKSTFRNFKINKIIQVFCDKKAELYYNVNYGKRKVKKKERNKHNILDHSTIREKLFNTTVKEILESKNDVTNLFLSDKSFLLKGKKLNSNSIVADDSAIEKILQQMNSIDKINYISPDKKTINTENIENSEKINLQMSNIQKKLSLIRNKDSLNLLKISYLNSDKKLACKTPLKIKNPRNKDTIIEESKTHDVNFNSLQASDDKATLFFSKKDINKLGISKEEICNHNTKNILFKNTIDTPTYNPILTDTVLSTDNENKSKSKDTKIFKSSLHMASNSVSTQPPFLLHPCTSTHKKTLSKLTDGGNSMKLTFSLKLNKFSGKNLEKASIPKKSDNNPTHIQTPIINNINININSNIDLESLKNMSRNKKTSLVKLPSKDNKLTLSKETLNSELSKEILNLIDKKIFSTYQHSSKLELIKDNDKNLKNLTKQFNNNSIINKTPFLPGSKFDKKIVNKVEMPLLNNINNNNLTPLKRSSSKKGLLEFLKTGNITLPKKITTKVNSNNNHSVQKKTVLTTKSKLI